MVMNLGAYATEIIRAGIEATPRGQIEAAREPGAQPRCRCSLRVVLPPALKQGVAGDGEPDHHRDARLGGVRPDLDARS